MIDNWDTHTHVMTRNQYGVYEIVVRPLANGKVAIPHGSKVKVDRVYTRTIFHPC